MKNAITYSVVMLLIMVSGNSAVKVIGLEPMIILLFLIAGLLFLFRPAVITPESIIFILCVGSILVVHILVFGTFVLNASISFLLQILTAFMLMAAMPRFLSVFVNCMFAISLIAIPMYFLVWLPRFEYLFEPLVVYRSSEEMNIGFYNFRGYAYESGRNSGPFWEPGAFAGYLSLALFVMILLREHSKQSIWKLLTILLALLTTLSTMGYVAFLVVLFAYIWQLFRKKSPALLILGFTVFALAISSSAVYAYFKIPFLKEKIDRQIVDTGENREGAQKNRFGNALFDLEFIRERPLFGWSANVDTRTAVDITAGDSLAAQGNALSGTAVRFGIVGWILIMSRFLVAISRASNSLVLGGIGLSLLCVMLTSEQYLNFPLIMTLFFMQRYHLIGKYPSTKRTKIIRNKQPA